MILQYQFCVKSKKVKSVSLASYFPAENEHNVTSTPSASRDGFSTDSIDWFIFVRRHWRRPPRLRVPCVLGLAFRQVGWHVQSRRRTWVGRRTVKNKIHTFSRRSCTPVVRARGLQLNWKSSHDYFINPLY